MNKSYKEIVATSTFVDYKEDQIGRIEYWVDEKCEYYCAWFFSNDTEIPNTIYIQSL